MVTGTTITVSMAAGMIITPKDTAIPIRFRFSRGHAFSMTCLHLANNNHTISGEQKTMTNNNNRLIRWSLRLLMVLAAGCLAGCRLLTVN